MNKKRKPLDYHRNPYSIPSVWFIIVIRLFAALYILINPLWGFILATFFDYWDAYVFKNIAKMSWFEYHRLDKYLDWISYVSMLIVGSIRGYFLPLLLLLSFRFIGHMVFLKKKDTKYFVLFPNLYEIAFIWLVIISELFKFEGLGFEYGLWLLALFIVKEVQEMWLHLIWPTYLRENGYPPVLRKLGYTSKVEWF